MTKERLRESDDDEYYGQLNNHIDDSNTRRPSKSTTSREGIHCPVSSKTSDLHQSHEARTEAKAIHFVKNPRNDVPSNLPGDLSEARSMLEGNLEFIV